MCSGSEGTWVVAAHIRLTRISCMSFRFIYLFIYLFMYFERGRERACKQGRDTERGRHRSCSRLQAPSCQCRAQRGARTHGPRDRDLSRSRPLNRLSHPGAPKVGEYPLKPRDFSLPWQPSLFFLASKLPVEI